MKNSIAGPDNSVVQAPEPGAKFRSHLGSTRWAPIRKTEVRVGHRKCQECFASAALFVGCSQNMRVSVSGDVLMLLTPQSYCFFDTFVNVGVSAVSRTPLRVIVFLTPSSTLGLVPLEAPKKSANPGCEILWSRGPQGGVKFRSHFWEHEMGTHNGCPSRASDFGTGK